MMYISENLRRREVRESHEGNMRISVFLLREDLDIYGSEEASTTCVQMRRFGNNNGKILATAVI